MDINEFIFREKLRGDCFRFLSACFYYPKKEIFMQESLFKNLTEALKKVCPDASVFSEKMEEAFSFYSDEDLLVDYSKLFVGPYELIAPPYGSVYLDNKRKVMGNSTMEVLKIYQEAGLSISDDFKELPDHIAAQLEFMYYLAFKEAEALEKSDIDTAERLISMQQEFLNGFLRRWVAPFCKKIKEGTNNKFYLALADCVSVFVTNQCAMENIPEPLKGLMIEV